MGNKEFHTKNEQDTIQLGKKIGTLLKPGDIVCLFGNLGTGKTTLVKGLLSGLKGKPNEVNSPTFTLMNDYEGRLAVYHFDLYRLDDIKEIVNIGYEEFFYGEGVAVIEWAEKLKNLMPEEYLGIKISHGGETTRKIKIEAKGKRSKELAGKITKK